MVKPFAPMPATPSGPYLPGAGFHRGRPFFPLSALSSHAPARAFFFRGLGNRAPPLMANNGSQSLHYLLARPGHLGGL